MNQVIMGLSVDTNIEKIKSHAMVFWAIYFLVDVTSLWTSQMHIDNILYFMYLFVALQFMSYYYIFKFIDEYPQNYLFSFYPKYLKQTVKKHLDEILFVHTQFIYSVGLAFYAFAFFIFCYLSKSRVSNFMFNFNVFKLFACSCNSIFYIIYLIDENKIHTKMNQPASPQEDNV